MKSSAGDVALGRACDGFVMQADMGPLNADGAHLVRAVVPQIKCYQREAV